MEKIMAVLQANDFSEDVFGEVSIAAKKENNRATDNRVNTKEPGIIAESNKVRRKHLIEKCNKINISNDIKSIVAASLIRDNMAR
jgi:hypothetical protein